MFVIAKLPELHRYAGMRICPRCHALFGECGKPTPQRCRCPASEHDEKWPDHDFNTAVELCRCCGLGLLASGSKWSVWFCRECKERVGRLNGRHGRSVIPIGRHSFHAGYMLSGKQAENPIEVHAFLEGYRGLSESMDVLEEWAGIAVARNLAEAGFAPDADPVGLLDYVEAMLAFRLPREDRFRQMVRHFERVGRERGGRSRSVDTL